MASAEVRSELANEYLDQLPYPPYPVQEEALLAWFTADQGVLVCAPTGTGKTLIAQAALFEALHANTVAYYTTPLIALTEQKFREMQECAVRWGFRAEDVGLVTGNRRVNRDECWSVAEQLKGLPLLGAEQRGPLHAEVNRLDWTRGVGPKIRQMLHRGVGVHHAGMLPKYRRVVEDLFARKLLGVVICTETLASGINLPARSVVLSSLVKGPFGKQKLVDASSAHQIFGRAGRPQFDDRGYVFALAHEDDVKILRWKEKYDQIPENAKDPALLKAKKALKRKKPTRSDTRVYWGEGQFRQLQGAPPGKLYSKGPLPWRLLAYLLKLSPEVSRVRAVVRKRLMDAPRIKASETALDRMLLTLAENHFVTLDPPPPPPPAEDAPAATNPP